MADDLGGQVVTGAQLGELFGLTDRRIRQLAEEGLPRDGHGQYPLAASVRWYVERLKRSSTEMDDARRRKILADAQIKETQLAEKAGALAPVGEIIQAVEGDYARVRARLLTIPPRLGSRFGDAELRQALADAIDEALSELSAADELAGAADAAGRAAASAAPRPAPGQPA